MDPNKYQQPPSGYAHPPDNLVYTPPTAPASGVYGAQPGYAPQPAYPPQSTYQPPTYATGPGYTAPPSYGAAPYSAPPPFAPSYGTTAPPSGPYGGAPQINNKFSENVGYRDLLFYILFVAHVVAFFIILGVSTTSHKSSSNNSTVIANNSTSNSTSGDDISGTEVRQVIGVCAICAVAACACAALWLVVMRKFAEQLIYITMILNIVVCLVVAVVFFAMGQVVLGILFLLMGLLNGLFFYWWRSRIPFAREMLKSIAVLTERFPAPIYVAFVGTVIQFGWVVLWIVVASLVQKNFESGPAGAITVWLVFSFYWTSQVIKNVIHVTTSGVFATWYFMEGTVGIPPNPTAKSLKRALTTSFGSICLGSLIVALLQTLRAIVRFFRNDKNALLAAIMDCILGCIENLVQYFNFYAYTQVAIYGKTFCQAAKATWDLLHSHGFEAIVNDNLISGVLAMGCILGGAATALVGGVIGHIIVDRYWVLLAVLGFFIGFSLVMLVMEVVESGVATIFVCFAEDPAALQRNSPELYNRFRSTYGNVLSFA